MDPRSGLSNRFKRVASVLYNYSYVFEDGANNIHNESAVPCGYTEASWTAASNANDTLLGPSLIIYNGLGTLGDGYGKPPPSNLLNPTAFGGMMEDCYGKDSFTNPLPTSTCGRTTNTEGDDGCDPKALVCRGLSSFEAKTSMTRRTYQYASFLLTYDPASSIISEKYITKPSNLAVFPEEGPSSRSIRWAIPGRRRRSGSSRPIRGTYGRLSVCVVLSVGRVHRGLRRGGRC